MKALYPGTFDPPTLGHLDIAKRAATFCDHVVIAVGNNPQKKTCAFSQNERVQMWKDSLKINNVSILPFEGLLVDFAKEQNITLLLKAMRNTFDFEHETVQGQMNRILGNIETLYLVVDEKYRMISSTLIKEIAQYGRRLHQFIPSEIEEIVFQRLKTISK